MDKTLQSTTLPNGIRVITDTIPSVESVALGFWVNVGTRNEDMSENGVAHMVEHMLFKGTQKRDARQISEEIENVGGQMNAYTSREVTSYHMHLLKEHAGLALDVLADMLQNSTMPEDEVERERQVILQEIGMCTDTPDDLVYDNYYEKAYPGQTLGAPILGTSEIISKMPRDTLQNYVSRFYRGENLVVSAAGNLDHDHICAKVESLTNALEKGEKAAKPEATYQGGEHRHEKELEQTHIMLGFPTCARNHEDFYATKALSTLLGGGMSSRLFYEIREKRGLVYAIYSMYSAYQDNGQFMIYAGTSPEGPKELIPVLCDELMKVQSDITQEELDRAKAQMKSGILMSFESMMSRADQNAKHMLFRDKLLDKAEIIEKIDALQIDDLQRAAINSFSATPTLSGLGPLQNLQTYDDVTGRLHAAKAA